MRPLAIIQARYGATRLPGKVLADIEGSPLLAHVIRRVKASQCAKVVLACPDTPENDAVAAIGEAEGVGVFRGSEDDVLSRYYWAANQPLYEGYDPIVRITGEDWAKDYRIIDYALKFWESGGPPHDREWHYQHLGYRPIYEDGTGTPAGMSWPVGCDVEVFSRIALEEAHKLATEPYDREHVCPFMARNWGVVQVANPTPRFGYDYRRKWSVDEEWDLAYARRVYRELYAKNPLFGYVEIVEAGL